MIAALLIGVAAAFPVDDPRRRRRSPRPARADLAFLRRRRAELRHDEGRRGSSSASSASCGRRQVYFRTHNLLTTGDGTPALKWGSTNAYTEDAQGRPGLRLDDPRSHLRHLPRARRAALRRRSASCRRRCRRSRSRTSTSGDRGCPTTRSSPAGRYPPKDYAKWGELVYQWAKHCVERYGTAEVERWYWETWNEANIGYWRGTPEEFLQAARLRDRRRAARAAHGAGRRAGHGRRRREVPAGVPRALPRGRTGRRPLDFVSFHAKGAPTYVDGHVRMGIANQLATIDQGFATIASFPELKATPIVIGESDPEGCAACQGPQLAYRNGTMYSSYTAASFARKHDLAAQARREPRRRAHLGVRVRGPALLRGLPRARDQRHRPAGAQRVPHVQRRWAASAWRSRARPRCRSTRSSREGVRRRADVGGAREPRAEPPVPSWSGTTTTTTCPGPDAAVEPRGRGPARATPARRRSTHYRIDEDHSNAYAAWKRMGSPLAPTRAQYEELEAASRLARLADEPSRGGVAAGSLALALHATAPGGLARRDRVGVGLVLRFGSFLPMNARFSLSLLRRLKPATLPLATLLLLAGQPLAADERPLRVDDLFALKDVDDPQLSPDGQWVAYTVTTDAEKDKSDRDVWMAPFAGGEAIRVTLGKKRIAAALQPGRPLPGVPFRPRARPRAGLPAGPPRRRGAEAHRLQGERRLVRVVARLEAAGARRLRRRPGRASATQTRARKRTRTRPKSRSSCVV